MRAQQQRPGNSSCQGMQPYGAREVRSNPAQEGRSDDGDRPRKAHLVDREVVTRKG